MPNQPLNVHSLKRPRSTSQPPSPSSSSSPKRAASEDNFTGTSEGGDSPIPSHSSIVPTIGALGLLGSMHVPAAGSSPLRYGGEDEGWVRRTEEVHLTSETGEVPEEDLTDMNVDEEPEVYDKEKFTEQYTSLLSAVSPPFEDWSIVYIIPATILQELKALAFSDTTPSSLPKIDLTALIQDTQGEEVVVIDTIKDAEGRSSLGATGSKTTLWNVKLGLEENVDFQFVSEEGWRNIVQWYGPYNGPSLPRFCQPGEKIQMVPPVFTVYLIQRSTAGPQLPTEPMSAIKPFRVSCPSSTTLAQAAAFLLDTFKDYIDLEEEEIRVWTIDVSSQAGDNETLSALKSLKISPKLLVSIAGNLLPDSDQTRPIGDLGLESGDSLAIETKKRDAMASWTVDVNSSGRAVEKPSLGMIVPTAPAPLFSKPAFFGGSSQQASASTSAASSVSGMQTRSQAKRTKHGKGLVGLVNLGNTCFMNSAVQCLSNTPELNEYFLSGVYQDELNPDNPLGMHGEIANAFGETIESLWGPSSAHASFSPRRLKWKTGHFAPQFAGYGQHDTQEFIAFLLDGLHEDLNRIKRKPYIEKPDWKPGGGARELAELGKECWEGYKKRNDSVIVDLFQGQLKSTLVCPECTKESITLDPFMYLTVPLPIAQTKVFKCLYVPANPEQPQIRLKLLIPLNASFMQVKEKIASLVGTKASNLLGFDLWKGYVYAWYCDSDHNGEAKENDVAVFYELPVPVTSSRKAVGVSPSEPTITVPVYTFRTIETTRSSYRQEPEDCALQPFFITLTKAEAADPVAVREAITKGYSRWAKEDAKEDLRVHSGSRRAAHALPAAEEEESVAEIHLDGDQARVVEVPAHSTEEATDNDTTSMSGSTRAVSPLPQRATSFASLSDAASIKSSRSGKLVPRGDLFKVHVADASSNKDNSTFSLSRGKTDSVVGIYAGTPRHASGSWSRLEDRKKAKKGMFGSIASGFKSMVGSTYQSEDEPSPPATPVSPPLVVRPGEGIYCEWTHQRFNEFFDVVDTASGVTEEVVDPEIAKENAKRREGRTISLDDCLDEFSKEETLGQDDLWYCPQCKKHQAATKKLEIYQAPDILVICLKRFGSSRRLNDKLDHLVSFPMEGLDLSDRIDERKIAQTLQLSDEEAAHYGFQSGDEPMIYDLYAVDNHFGGLGGGHYTAFCRNKVDGEWYNYDDSRVSKANPESVQSRAAYLLFYRKRTSRPIGGISKIKAEEASRAASPVPSSPELEEVDQGITSEALTRASSGSTSSTDPVPSASDNHRLLSERTDIDPPSYDDDLSTPPTPAPPSPTLSASSDMDTTMKVPDLTAVASSIGFGNSAWGRTTSADTMHVETVPPSYQTTSLQSDPAQSLPTPPSSDDGMDGKISKPSTLLQADQDTADSMSVTQDTDITEEQSNDDKTA